MGERKDNFKPMGLSFETMNNIFKYFDNNKSLKVYKDDSMSEADKIKVLTLYMTHFLFFYTVGDLLKSSVKQARDTIVNYIENIPTNSMDIMNAKNEFYIVDNILMSFLMIDESVLPV